MTIDTVCSSSRSRHPTVHNLEGCDDVPPWCFQELRVRPGQIHGILRPETMIFELKLRTIDNSSFSHIR